jgi:uncharacterized protein (TIGR03086 family)
MDLIDLFDRGTAWTATKVAGATEQLDGKTPCDKWDVRAVLNHLIDSQQYFAATARGEDGKMPDPTPPSLIGDDPVRTYEETTRETLRAHREPGVLEKTGPSLGIGFVDQLVHGWDLAKATGQDDTIPDDLATAAFSMIDGQLTDDRRGEAFGKAGTPRADASSQEKLLAYTGRTP